MTNQIFITIKDGKVSVKTKGPMVFTDFLTTMSTAILSAMNSIVASVPEESKNTVKEDLYDMYNAAASNTLHYFAPEIEMRPHLTTQAILEAENAIINREYKKKVKK